LKLKEERKNVSKDLESHQAISVSISSQLDMDV